MILTLYFFIPVFLYSSDNLDHLKSACREVLRMMNGAACFMSDTLNDVLSHEEGAMNITKTGELLLNTPPLINIYPFSDSS